MERKKLLVHDMSESEWEKVKDLYKDYDVISANGTIKPCIGCFTCWTKTPGRCVIKDGYDQMGAKINACEELVINSRFTYGGFSAFIKNIFDRSLGYVLPYFEVYDSEMHHKRRYQEVKNVTFIFRGHNLSIEDREKARRYVTAVCRNLQGKVKEVIFEDDGKEDEPLNDNDISPVKDKVMLLNCSLRGNTANSKILLDKLAESLTVPFEQYDIVDNKEKITQKFLEAETVVLAMPLYVDGLSSTVIRFFNKLETLGKQSHKNIYVLANMGLYESKQLINLLDMVRCWCHKMNYSFNGAISIGAGELVGVLLPQMFFGPVKSVIDGLKNFAMVISQSKRIKDLYIEPFMFPRDLYIWIANRSWDNKAYKLKMKPKDLCRRRTVE